MAALDSARPRAETLLRDFTWSHDAGRIEVPTGRLLMYAVGDVPVAAVIEGDGRFHLSPPDAVERWQLDRVVGAPEADFDVESAVLLVGPDTWRSLAEGLTLSPVAQARDDRLLRDAVDYLRSDDQVDPGVVRALLNQEGERFIHAHLNTRDGGPWAYRFDSTRPEEVSLSRDGAGDTFEPVVSFHRQEDLPAVDAREGARHGAQVLRYEIESWITPGPDYAAHARLHLVTELQAGRWVPFSLSPDLRIDSLRWGDGAEATFERPRDDAGQFWVRLPSDPAVLELNAWYAGETVRYRDLWYYFERPTGWYPSTGRTDAVFDMLFHVDDRYAFLGSGHRVEESSSDGVVTSRWVMDRPESQASFNLGNFEEIQRSYEGLPSLRLQVNDDFHRRLMSVRSSVILQEKGAAEAVATDLAASLAFFQSVYGPIDVAEFNASEIPYSHGQAFPGLIHLSMGTFLSTGAGDDGGRNESFRAHEVAHQWWGFLVEPHRDRDRWLAEGLAQFSGLWYMQIARNSPATYFEALEDSRDRLLDRRDEMGPISLGPRLVVGGRPEDYPLATYDKGAWAIHMLRNLLMDLETMDESAFRTMMRDVTTRFGHGRITTPDFRAVVEEHMGGVDMGWFFDQWIHGTGIPTWRWAWSGVQRDDGYHLTLRVRQSEVPATFRSVVPVTLSFGAEGSASVRVLVEGPETLVELPVLPREPDTVVFNDYLSVLADVREEGW